MRLQIDQKACDECGTCISVCPENALIFADKLQVDRNRCILCGRCIKVCPFAALDKSE